MTKNSTLLTSREKVTGLLCVVFLFLTMTVLCAYILFMHDADYQFSNGKKEALSQLGKVNHFQSVQSDNLEKIKEIDSYVSKINPEVNASYEKRELCYIIGEIKKVSSDNRYDSRYRIFEQVASFYEMKLFDRERLSVSQRNIEKFKIELDNCRGGIETIKNN